MECSTVPWRRLRSTTALSAGLELDAFRIKWGIMGQRESRESVRKCCAKSCFVRGEWCVDRVHSLPSQGWRYRTRSKVTDQRPFHSKTSSERCDKKWQKMTKRYFGWISKVMWQAEVQLVSGCHWVSFHIFSHFFPIIVPVISTNHP